MGQRCRAARGLVTVGLLAAVTAAASGCTAGEATSSHSTATTASTTAGTAATKAESPAPSSQAGPGLAYPGCSAATAAGPALGSGGTTTVTTGGNPFGVATTPDGKWAFAVSTRSGLSEVQVLRLSGGHTTSGAPDVSLGNLPDGAAGAAVTPDGKYLLVAAGSGAVVVSVARAEAGAAHAVLGTLSAVSASGRAAAEDSAIEVAVSSDSRFAFVTLEYSDEAVVFNLAKAATDGFGSTDYVGAIPLGNAAVGMAVSPDGQWLYATSEGAVPAQHPVGIAPKGSNGCGKSVPGTDAGEPAGTLSVIDLQRAKTDPAHSVIATVDAGYQPVRVVTDGTQV